MSNNPEDLFEELETIDLTSLLQEFSEDAMDYIEHGKPSVTLDSEKEWSDETFDEVLSDRFQQSPPRNPWGDDADVEYTWEYLPPRHLFWGNHFAFVIKNLAGTELWIYVDSREQINAFIQIYPDILQKGQVVRFECDYLGLHGWLRGKAAIEKDARGRRIINLAGSKDFESLMGVLAVTPERIEEVKKWRKYVKSNPYWFIRGFREKKSE
jgi:hypothetical protein